MASLTYPSSSEIESCDVCSSVTLDLELLPCTHLVCVRCFEEAAVSGGSSTGCIICDSNTMTPNYDIPSPPCHLCSENVPSIAYCANCSVYLCEFCEQAHLRQKRTSNHRVFLLELAPPTSETSLQEFLQPSVLPSCAHFDSAHPTSGYYCEGCVQFICPRCKEIHHTTSNNNNNHVIISMNDMSLHVFEKLQNLLSKTQPLVSTLKDSVHTIDALMISLEQKIEQTSEDICHIIDSHIVSLEEHKIALLTELDRIKEAKLSVLSEQINTLAQALDSIHATCSETSHVLATEQDRHDNNDLCDSLSVKVSLALKLEELADTRYDYRPAEDDYINFQPHLQAGYRKGFQVHGIIDTKAPSVIHSSLTHTKGETYELGQDVTLLLTLKDREGVKKCNGGDYVELRVLGPNGVAIKNSKVIDEQDGSYKLVFIPSVIGEHKVSVMIGGRYIQGCPLFVQVNKKEEIKEGEKEQIRLGESVESGWGLDDKRGNESIQK